MSMESSLDVANQPVEIFESRLLASLRAEAANAARLELDGIQRAFSAAFPHLDGSPNRRMKLLETLQNLAAAGYIRLPADRKRRWQNQPAPALPLRLTLARLSVKAAQRFDQRSFPWAPEIAFVADFPVLHTPDDALSIHEFFKRGGSQSPIVPTKERSWQIFGDEKRLDELQCGQLFGKGRLTLDLLRCRNVTQILAFSPAPAFARSPVLIVENESTFHSFCRLNHQLAIYGGVVFGDGNTVLKAADFLFNLAETIVVNDFKYFGDLDPRGLRIPQSLSDIMRKFKLTVSLDEFLYAELLKAPLPKSARPQPATDELIRWLPTAFQEQVRDRLANFGRIAQEALGWEKLCALYHADPYVDFRLGFSHQK